MARMSAEERRGRLLTAAIAVMSRDGVANTSTRSIVAEAGMQIGVFHYCFRSKDELIGEVIEVITGNCLEAIGEVLAVGAEPDAAIRAAVEGYWTHVRSRPSEHQLSYELIQHSLRQPGEEQPAKDQYERYLAGIERFLTAVAQSGGFTWRGSPDVLARLTLAVLQGVTFQWLAIQDDARARELLEQLVEVLQARVGQVSSR